ncbi:uncharacterized protein LOC107268717 [Cephus cinctus]|uniref:Uncharacterized protein LOC107268717 n=1 Tax=Cephus cinctus TaxID=211228 RepID=A0AAJ7W297_CEPCN|nr:uncharacterized protein LOC107268717 [Cephus cinctus]
MGPWAFGVPLVLVSALGLLLNAYVLLVVGLTKQTQQQQTTNTVLLIHLGAVEAAVCLVLLVFTTGGWNVAGTSCVLHGFLLALLHPVALWTVTGLNCDRYYAIAAPLHYAALVSPRRVAVGLAASWTGALLLCLPPFSGLVPPYAYSPGLGCCAPDFGNGAWGSAAAWYGAVYAFLGLGLPAVLVTVCNLRVLGIARYHRHRIASAIYEVTLSAQVTITHQRNPFSFVPTVTAPSAGGPPRFHSAATTVMQLVGSLYLLYFPYCGMIVWEACGAGSQPHLQVHPKFASVASLLLACSPPVNGLLYGLKSRTLRRSVQNYWRKKATKSELQQEIQARTPSVAGSRRPSGSGAPFLPFPPLQRRLSEALISFASYRSGNNFESRNIRNTFYRNRLQPAASCNTLRVPTSESGETGRLVRSSASAASLMGAHYQSEVNGENATTNFDTNLRSKCDVKSSETPKRSPRILITRAYSEESRGGGSPLLRKPFGSNVTAAAPFEKRRWRHRSTGSDSSTGSSEGGIWTTGVAPKIAKTNVRSSTEIWPMGRRFTKVKTLEEGAIFAAVRPNNNSESSDTTDTTATTVTTTSTLLTRPLQEVSGRVSNFENAFEKLSNPFEYLLRVGETKGGESRFSEGNCVWHQSQPKMPYEFDFERNHHERQSSWKVCRVMESWSCSTVISGRNISHRRKIRSSSSMSENSMKNSICGKQCCCLRYGVTKPESQYQSWRFWHVVRRGRIKVSAFEDASIEKRQVRKRIFILVMLVAAVLILATILGVTLSGSSSSLQETAEADSLIPPDPLEAPPPSWSRLRQFKRGAVCADGAPCALIGKSILDRNGSAVDATLAAMICNGLINMQSMGFGGGFLMTIYERAAQKAIVLNARDCAPQAARTNMYEKEDKDASKVGALASGVPGELAGYWEAHRRFGKLPWSEIFQPSIELCETGYNLTQIQYDGLLANKNSIHRDPTLKKWFVDPETNEFKKAGSVIRPEELCRTMKIIARKSAGELYNGTLGKTLVEDLKQRGGIITMKDLNDYRAKWEDPVETKLSNGEQVFTAGLPGSGALLAFALNVLDEFKFSANSLADVNSTVTTYHRIIETFKYAYAFRNSLGDQDFVNLTDILGNLTSKDYARSIREKINDNRTWNDPGHYGASTAGDFGDHGTAHISVLAPNGDAVSVTSTINIYFGSGIVSQSTGILMNSGMDDFGIPSRYSYFGLPPSPNNYIQPGKRALSSMAPTILVENNGEVRMVIGAAGGTKITTALAYTIARQLWMNNTIKQAVDAARIHHQLFPMKIIYEFGVPAQVIDGLKKLGHQTARYRNRGSVVCVLVQQNGTVYANADFRKGGDVYGID